MTRDCEFCGSPAQLHFTEVVGGEKTTVDVCAKCAREQGIVGEPTFGPLPDVQKPSIEIHVTTAVDPASVPTAPRRCPGCNTSLVEIRKVGRVGCPACYTAFREHLAPLLQRVHGATRHVEPASTGAARDTLRRLESALRRAVAEEDFEGAARLRDEIRAARAQVEGEADA